MSYKEYTKIILYCREKNKDIKIKEINELIKKGFSSAKIIEYINN